MKKMKILSFLLVGLCLTGCGKGKKIECAYYEQSSDFKMTYDYTFNYDKSGDTLKTLELIMDVEFENKEDLDEFIGQANNDVCEFVKGELSSMSKNANCKSTEDNNKISITVTYKYDKLTDSEKENLPFNFTYNEFKELYESNTYEQDMCVFDSDKKMDPVLKSDGVLGSLNNSRKSAAEDSAYGILKSAETAEMEYMVTNHGEAIPVNDPKVGVVFVCSNGKCSYTPNGKEPIYLDFKGTSPTDGEVLLDGNLEASIKKPLVINGYKCTMNNDKIECNK